jgi:hypothetical protein
VLATAAPAQRSGTPVGALARIDHLCEQRGRGAELRRGKKPLGCGWGRGDPAREAGGPAAPSGRAETGRRQGLADRRRSKGFLEQPVSSSVDFNVNHKFNHSVVQAASCVVWRPSCLCVRGGCLRSRLRLINAPPALPVPPPSTGMWVKWAWAPRRST